MRDYGNMPVLEWSDSSAPYKAKAQILHQEPVILQMPQEFDGSIDGDLYGCRIQDDGGILYDCDGGRVLDRLATRNALPGLHIIAEACEQSNSQIDIDIAGKRIIVHD